MNERMNKLRIAAASLPLAAAPAVFAHPGHPTLNPHHTHGPLELNPVALLLLAAIAIGVALIGRGTSVRRIRPWRNNKK